MIVTKYGLNVLLSSRNVLNILLTTGPRKSFFSGSPKVHFSMSRPFPRSHADENIFSKVLSEKGYERCRIRSTTQTLISCSTRDFFNSKGLISKLGFFYQMWRSFKEFGNWRVRYPHRMREGFFFGNFSLILRYARLFNFSIHDYYEF